MKRIFIAFTLFTLLLASCSTSKNDVSGVWELTEWNITDGFDINKDGVANTNVLKEIDCVNKETLVFGSTGAVSSNHTFNPSIEIALVNGTSNNYIFNVICDDEGVISFAAEYTLEGNDVLINDSVSTLHDNKLSRVFVDAIEVYNEDFTEVIATKNLTLVYTKK